MHLAQFAETILFGATLSEKLVEAHAFAQPVSNGLTETGELGNTSLSAGLAAKLQTLQLPAREAKLSRFEKVRFPSVQKLADPNVRAQVLHFFANHELLALEIMALTLLKFPQAPVAFQMGVAHTMQEEQAHLRLYIARMNELGMQFGDLPLNDYFWQVMKGVNSPYEFVTQMSLTFEQANLDFSLFYKNEIAKTGDEKTTALLERVYQEEIGHVKHGLKWFRQWKPQEMSDWQAYKTALVFPLTPRRGKGQEFSAEARNSVGFDEQFIHEMQITGASKGRPPVVFLWNPSCESEVARGAMGHSAAGYSLTEAEQAWQQELDHLPLFLAKDSDVVLVQKRPPLPFLQKLNKAGFFIPEFWEKEKISALPHPKLGGVAPWGQSPVSHATFSPILPRLVHKQTSQCDIQFYSKAFALKLRQEFFKKGILAQAFFEEEKHCAVFNDTDNAMAHTKALLEAGHTVLWKAPFGTSGRMALHIKELAELSKEAFTGWLQKALRNQKEIVVEPYFNRVLDFSIQLIVENERVKILETRPFINNARRNYKGTLLGAPKLWMNESVLRYLHTPTGGPQNFSPLEQLQVLAKAVGTHLHEQGYRGPAGIDAFLWRAKQGQYKFRPFVELNPRYTLGRVALELEAHVSNGSPAAWMFFMPEDAKQHSVTPQNIAQLELRYPVVRLPSGVIESGVLVTNPIATSDINSGEQTQAPKILSLLVVGKQCLQDPALEFFMKHLPPQETSPRL